MAWQVTSEQNYSSVYTLHIQLKGFENEETNAFT